MTIAPEPKIAPSRKNKTQLAAHLEPSIVERMKIFARKRQLSITEVIAMSVNEAVSVHGVGPLLQVSRERLVHRVRSPSQVRTDGPECRAGTKRVAAFFNKAEVERLRAFSKEKAIPQEHLIADGLARLLAA
ncbi:hypothetical protein [Rhizobium sp. BK176]|uniref:hypothetical protein n=1 Tax=Rhizobium sp. BK176 TaxID=2587071 RepID=UPI0021671DA5|nr:hypothetical protein [Rhizobium sp. BK176]MCS4089617.1 hypothetical protein [Rhizobium sp. BK176]